MERTTTYDAGPRLRLLLTQSSSPAILLNSKMIIFGAARRNPLEIGVVGLGGWFSPMGPHHGIQPTPNEER